MENGKAQFSSGITVGPVGGADIYSLRGVAKNDPQGFIARTTKFIQDGRLRLEDLRDMRTLYAALADVQVPVMVEDMGVKRSIMASAFPVLTGNLVIAGIQAGYDRHETIGQHLVREIEDNKKITTFASLHGLDKNISDVKEGEDFPEISASEETVQIGSKRNGRKLTITKEAIEENNLADIAGRVNILGEIASDWIEEQTIARVTDHHGSASSAHAPYVYKPNGTGTALFSASANTPGPRAPLGNRVTSNALADYTDLDAARARLTAMKNNMGKSIAVPWSEVVVLVPDALIGVASRIFNSEFTPGVVNEKSNWGPGGRWNIPAGRLLSSNKLDDLSTTAWYMGRFQKQFIRKWKLRLEYVTLGMDTQSYLNSRLAFQARVAWDVEIGALDYVYVVQCLSASTAPYDD